MGTNDGGGGGGKKVGGALAKCGPLTEDWAAKLKRDQLNMTSYWRGVLFSSRGWNLCRIGQQFLSKVDNSEVLGKIYGLTDGLLFYSYLASRWGGGEGGVGHMFPIPSVTLPGSGGKGREGEGCVPSWEKVLSAGPLIRRQTGLKEI